MTNLELIRENWVDDCPMPLDAPQSSPLANTFGGGQWLIVVGRSVRDRVLPLVEEARTSGTRVCCAVIPHSFHTDSQDAASELLREVAKSLRGEPQVRQILFIDVDTALEFAATATFPFASQYSLSSNSDGFEAEVLACLRDTPRCC